jgi:hypothetical protein
MYFKGDYLRVLSPRTVDGANVMFDENEARVWKEDFLPLSAKRDLDLQNEKLPDQLKKKITVVSSQPVINRSQAQAQIDSEPDLAGAVIQTQPASAAKPIVKQK